MMVVVEKGGKKLQEPQEGLAVLLSSAKRAASQDWLQGKSHPDAQSAMGGLTMAVKVWLARSWLVPKGMLVCTTLARLMTEYEAVLLIASLKAL